MKMFAVIFVFFCLPISGCTSGEPDFKKVTDSFVAATNSGVAKLVLLPVDVGDYEFSLNKRLTLTNTVAIARIVSEISFSEYPDLPNALAHAGIQCACKSVVKFRDGSEFSFYFYFLGGPRGTGIEYAIYPKLSLDSDGHKELLPGNHTLGRGYNLEMYAALQRMIKESGGGWIKASWAR